MNLTKNSSKTNAKGGLQMLLVGHLESGMCVLGQISWFDPYPWTLCLVWPSGEQ
jgi:hypothetical protein